MSSIVSTATPSRPTSPSDCGQSLSRPIKVGRSKAVLSPVCPFSSRNRNRSLVWRAVPKPANWRIVHSRSAVHRLVDAASEWILAWTSEAGLRDSRMGQIVARIKRGDRNAADRGRRLGPIGNRKLRASDPGFNFDSRTGHFFLAPAIREDFRQRQWHPGIPPDSDSSLGLGEPLKILRRSDPSGLVCFCSRQAVETHGRRLIVPVRRCSGPIRGMVSWRIARRGRPRLAKIAPALQSFA